MFGCCKCRPYISTSTSPGLILLSDLHKVQAQALLAPTAHPSVRVNRATNQPTPLLLKSEIDGRGGRGYIRRRHSPSFERWRWEGQMAVVVVVAMVEA